MKIGIDARMYSSSFTGIGRYVYELIHYLSLLDKKNEYVLFLNDPEFSSFQLPAQNFSKRIVNAKHYSFSEQTKFLKILLKEKLDLMHFTHFNAPIFYFKPSIVTIHDLTLSFFPGKKMTSPLQRFGYHISLLSSVKKAKKIIAVSKNTKKDLQTFFKISDEKIKVIYEAADDEFFKNHASSEILSTKTKYALNKPYLLYTGVWRNHKNLVNLIKAFSILKSKYQFDGFLVITGREDPFYPEVKEEVKKNNLENSIKFTGLVPENDLLNLYFGAEIYVFPSLYEGFGLPVLEAFAAGIPVCCSNSSSLPEICGEGNAVFFDPLDIDDIAKKIYSLISNPSLKKTLIENGKKRVKEFSWEKMAEETLKIYEEIINI